MKPTRRELTDSFSGWSVNASTARTWDGTGQFLFFFYCCHCSCYLFFSFDKVVDNNYVYYRHLTGQKHIAA